MYSRSLYSWNTGLGDRHTCIDSNMFNDELKIFCCYSVECGSRTDLLSLLGPYYPFSCSLIGPGIPALWLALRAALSLALRSQLSDWLSEKGGKIFEFFPAKSWPSGGQDWDPRLYFWRHFIFAAWPARWFVSGWVLFAKFWPCQVLAGPRKYFLVASGHYFIFIILRDAGLCPTRILINFPVLKLP